MTDQWAFYSEMARSALASARFWTRLGRMADAQKRRADARWYLQKRRQSVEDARKQDMAA